ncbi:MAG: ankyrin repeat domain-containing protein [Tatlockia sp.]|nr:ankyrin repeat domain-containing protein [Tatlockia sp.]
MDSKIELDINLKIRQEAANGNLETLKKLIKNNVGVDVNAPGLTTGKTALHQAVQRNQIEVLEYLLTLPNIKNIADKRGKTPSDYAIEKKHFDMVRLFCRTFTINFPAPPSDLACYLGPELYFLITKKGKSLLTEAIMAISQKIPPGKNYMGYSLLLLITLHSKNWEAIQLLMQKGEDPNSKSGVYQPMSFGNTPLHALIANEDRDAIKFVDIAHKAEKTIDFTVLDDQGKTTLLLAAKIRNAELVQNLLDKGAKVAVTIPDNNGLNILHIACALGDIKTFEIIKNLEDFEKLIEQKDKLDRYPADMLKLSDQDTRILIKSIYINPDRDLFAPQNDTPIECFKPAKVTFLNACLRDRKKINEHLASLESNVTNSLKF